MILNYRKITDENLNEVIKLSDTLTEGQKQCVAPNVYSIAEGSVNENAYYKGIYLDNTPIGFFMVSIPTEDMIKKGEETDFFLWRFMIAYDYQRKHYGSQVLDHIVTIAKSKGYKKMLTSCHMGEVSPYDFYIKYGFTDTGRVDHGEQVLELLFN